MQMFLPYFFLCKKVLLNNNRDCRASLRLKGHISDSILGGVGGGRSTRHGFLVTLESIGGHVVPPAPQSLNNN